MHTIWTGERVRLRPFTDEHEWVAMQEELHVEPNEFWGAWWHPRGKLKKDFEETGMLNPSKFSAFAIERLDTGEAMGFEEFGPNTGDNSLGAWLGTFIKRPHWHQGFGLEAKQLVLCYLFENHPYERVGSDTLANHKRAARGLFECGMHFEGRIRGAHFMDGQYHDIVCYTIYREEWEKLPIRQTVKRG